MKSAKLNEEVAALQAMAREPQTPERQIIVSHALKSRWEGVQSVALRVLSSWGGPEAKREVRDFYVASFARESAWTLRRVAADVIEPWIRAEDADWLLDLCFTRADFLRKRETLELVVRLPVSAARERLVRELESADPGNRKTAVIAISHMPFADKNELLVPLRDDPHRDVRRSAIELASAPRTLASLLSSIPSALWRRLAPFNRRPES